MKSFRTLLRNPLARGKAAGCLLGLVLWSTYELVLQPITKVPGYHALDAVRLGITLLAASWILSEAGVICSSIFRAMVIGAISCGVLMLLRAHLGEADVVTQLIHTAVGASFGSSIAGLAKVVATDHAPSRCTQPGL